MTAVVDPFALVAADDPYPALGQLRSIAPVHWLPDRQAWVVTGYPEARRVLVDTDAFTSEAMADFVTRPGQYDEESDGPTAVSIIGTDGEAHQRLRRIVNRGFTPRRVEPRRARIVEMAHELAPGDASRVVDLQSTFADVLPAMVIADLLGVDRDRQAEFHRWSEAMMLAVFGSPTDEQAIEVESCLHAMGSWLDDTIATRHDLAGDDLISVLLRAEAMEDVLDHNELRTFVFTLLVAGSITTAFLIGNGLLVAARHPEVWHGVASGHIAPADFVEEVLRYDAPAQIMLRTCRRDTDLGGRQVRAGAIVAVALGAANRDVRAFADPDRFRPAPRDAPHLAFGYGPHFCLGAALARLEATVAFEVLAQRASGIELAEPVSRLPSEFFRGPNHLMARLTPP